MPLFTPLVIVGSHLNQRWCGIKPKIESGSIINWHIWSNASSVNCWKYFSKIKKLKSKNLIYKLHFISWCDSLPPSTSPGVLFCYFPSHIKFLDKYWNWIVFSFDTCFVGSQIFVVEYFSDYELPFKQKAV